MGNNRVWLFAFLRVNRYGSEALASKRRPGDRLQGRGEAEQLTRPEVKLYHADRILAMWLKVSMFSFVSTLRLTAFCDAYPGDRMDAVGFP